MPVLQMPGFLEMMAMMAKTVQTELMVLSLFKTISFLETDKMEYRENMVVAVAAAVAAALRAVHLHCLEIIMVPTFQMVISVR